MSWDLDNEMGDDLFLESTLFNSYADDPYQYPEYVRKFNKNNFTEEEKCCFAVLYNPDLKDDEVLCEAEIDYVQQFYDFMKSARADTFVKVTHYNDFCLQMMKLLLTKVECKEIQDRLNLPPQEDALILSIYYWINIFLIYF